MRAKTMLLTIVAMTLSRLPPVMCFLGKKGATSFNNIENGLTALSIPRRLPESLNFSSVASSKTTLDPLIVCGPSGVGKGTVISKFMRELDGKDSFGFTVSHTTRSRREGEVNGVHYHFSSKEQMEQLMQANFFLETAHVHGNFYGTSWQAMLQVQQTGKRCLLDIDVQGVKRLKSISGEDVVGNFDWRPRYVFIAPPSISDLKNRLLGRGSETPESLKRRVDNAEAELEYGLKAGNFDAIVVNDDLRQCVEDFAKVVDELYR